MKLTRKLAFALVLGILIVMAGYAYLQVRREVTLFESDVETRDQRGEAFFLTLRLMWQSEGEERTRTLVAEIASALADHVETRWVRVDGTSAARPTVTLAPADRQAIAAGQIVRIVRRTDGGDLRRFAYIPMAAGEPAVLEVSKSLRRELTFVRMNRAATVLATVLITLVCGLIALVLGALLVGRPINLVREQARRMGAGDFSTRLSLPQHDEIGEMASEMNLLCDRLVAARDELANATEARIAALEQLRHADRLATVGQLASGVAHELGTPLSVVTARAGVLRDGDASATEVAESAAVIGEQAARMTAIIRQLLDLSRRRGPQLGVADLRPLVSRTVDLVSALAHASDVTIDIDLPPEPVLVEVDQNQLQQALAHIVVNAIQSMPPGGGRVAIGVHTRHTQPPADPDAPAREYVCLTIADEGTGIAPEHLARVFEPFFTTKPVGEGTGLGLSVAHGIIAEHRGWITVASESGKGSRFDVFLPPAPATTAAEVTVS